jgi:hypothetical protein
MNQRARLFAGGLALLSLSLVVTTVVFFVIDRSGAGASSAVLDILFLAIPISFSAVGCMLAVRRPENSIGWLCLVIGLLWSAEGMGWEVATWAGDRDKLGTAEWFGLLGFLWLPAVGLTGTHLVLRLPGGSLLSERWRRYSRFCTAVVVVVGVLVATEPGSVADVQGTQNPIGSEFLKSFGPLFVLFPLAVIGAIRSLVLRYRRSRGVERLQIRWIALGGVTVLAAVLTAFLPVLLGLASENSAPKIVEALFYVAFVAIPVAIGISVLRYRLYDIDVVINRTLVYGALTATLAGIYIGSVLLLQFLLSGLTKDSGLAVAASTLAVAALFRPARARIQQAVDRRFYRRKYDAALTLERFGARLRDEVDLVALGNELRGVVTNTMQPTHVSIWLKAPPSVPVSRRAEGVAGS